MFRNISSNTYFSNENEELEQLSTKDLYVIYELLYIRERSNSNFKDFCVHKFSLLANCGFARPNKNHYFLSSLFFPKSNTVLALKFINDAYTGNNAPFSYNHFKFSDLEFNFFWSKWKKLRRPSTEEEYNQYFLSEWKSKFTTYSKIGFLKIHDGFHITCINTKTFYKSIVSIKKPLLISPKYSSSSINKHISLTESKNFEFQFIRKNKVYNKGRYSRCRQNYRTGVYLCMYLSVVSIFGLYYWFYKFSFNFTYLWWLFIAFVGSFFLPKIFKYRLYEPNTLLAKFFDFFRWSFLLVKSIFF